MSETQTNMQPMADVALDTPIAAYGLPMPLLPAADVLESYARLSPSSGREPALLDDWWDRQEPEPHPLPPQEHRALATADGGWDVPSPLLSVHGPMAQGNVVDLFTGPGLWSAQTAVSAEHVARLRAALPPLPESGADLPVWPPIRLLDVRGSWWLMDGVHRVCAALAAGVRTLPARRATLVRLGECPCGWTGAPGGFLEHRCARV